MLASSKVMLKILLEMPNLLTAHIISAATLMELYGDIKILEVKSSVP